ncbi:MAG: cyclase family protein [Sphingomonadales bacterium]|nr:MAG: cyclase family protein [Sphingomonadales bacterium]
MTAASVSASPLATEVGKSPWGPEDEIGMLNLMTEHSRQAIMFDANAHRIYDLSVDYFVGMPSWHAIGDPRYQFWLTHTPRGAAIDNPMKVGPNVNRHVSYTGDAVSMYTHMGTHIDALNHFGLNGRIYNGFAADEHLGDLGWNKSGAESIPPIVARGVLIDVAAAKGEAMLKPNTRISAADLRAALARQKVELQPGDVVLIRTGRMALYNEGEAFIAEAPGLGMDAAQFLVESGAMVVGADNLSFEAFPSKIEGNYVPVHTYLLAQHGIPIIELAFLEDLARDQLFEFAFIGGSLKFRGASAAPLRPIAMPLRRKLADTP